MEFEDFSAEICKKRGPKGKFKIRNSWGIYDAYKYIRKNKWFDIGKPITEHDFYNIIGRINDYLVEEILNGNTVVFPQRMGKLEIRKKQKGVSIVNGKLKIVYPIKWNDTLKLWYHDEEARKNKVLLRDEDGDIYTIKYNNYDANYENKRYYQFAVNRFIKRKLKDRIKQGKIDSLW